MPNTIPPTLAELENCRDTILWYMGEAQKVADGAAKELRTLKAALDHVEELIRDYRSGNAESGKLAISDWKKPAA